MAPSKEPSRGVVSDTPRRLWKVSDVAAYLSVHPKDVYTFVGSKGLPCVRIGRRLRFDPSDVLRWISARKEG
jgi:excisionase family DNA binding protein